jgi:hypothetical protein
VVVNEPLWYLRKSGALCVEADSGSDCVVRVPGRDWRMGVREGSWELMTS